MKKKIVFVSGRFNILHPGHLRLLKFAKECGDHLVVGVESNKLAFGSVYVDEKDRLNSLKSINWVDEAFILKVPPKNYIKKKKPSIVVKGKEYENMFNEENNELNKYGGTLIFNSGEKMFSSIELIKNEQNLKTNLLLNTPKSFLNRRSIKISKIKNIIKKISKLNVCVMGDLIIDEYITCEPLGMSQEDPTLVISPINKTKFVGGAGIVAAHARSLGAKVDFYSVAGRDDLFKFAKKKLENYKVKLKIFLDSTRLTTLKQKFRSSEKTVMRVSHLRQNSISKNLQSKIFKQFVKNIKKYDLIVFSDFNYGCLPRELVKKIIDISKKHNKLIAADSQSSSQIGDIMKFKNVDLLTPTEHEARIGVQNHQDGLIILTEELRKKTSVKNIILKLGSEGILIHTYKKNKWDNDKILPLNNFPRDISGAGDALLIASAMTLACKFNIWEASYIGSIASAVQVSQIGNLPINFKDII